jgi:hypothetical protein
MSTANGRGRPEAAPHQDPVQGIYPDRSTKSPGVDIPRFTDWLKAQRHRSDPVGALSGEMAGDGGWPEPVSYQDAHDFLEGHDAPWFVIAALAVAWSEWRAERRRSR